jgi:DNA-binding PadR family transcriptional regulator
MSLNDWAVLGIVAEEPKHGWAVARELATGGSLGRVWTVSRPVVYRSLTTLIARDFVAERGAAPSERGPQRTILRATPRGRTQLRRWLETPVEHIRDLRGEFLVKVALLERAGQPVAPLAQRQLEALAPIIALYDESVSEPGFDGVLARWRKESVLAAQRFLEALVAHPR